MINSITIKRNVLNMKKGIIRYLDNYFGNSLKEKNIIITGANSGIGYTLSEELLYLGANVIMACRNLKKAEDAKISLLLKYPNAQITLYQLDVSSFTSIDTFIKQIINDNIQIDAFFNNAGTCHIDKTYNDQHIEMVMATNLIGPYYLNQKLLSYLIKQNYSAKIIFVSSVACYLNSFNYDDPFFDKHYKKFRIYAASKRGIIHMYHHFLRMYQNTNLQFYLTHPGITYTPISYKGYRSNFTKKFIQTLFPKFFHSVYKAALSYMMALKEKENGAYYSPRFFFGTRGYPKLKQIRKFLFKNETKTIEWLNKYTNN